MTFIKVSLLLILLVLIGVLNYQDTGKKARRLVDQCTEGR